MKDICEQCDVMWINGLKCHEHNCPLAWKDEIRICKWCGTAFPPQDKNQNCCDEECHKSYHGV